MNKSDHTRWIPMTELLGQLLTAKGRLLPRLTPETVPLVLLTDLSRGMKLSTASMNRRRAGRSRRTTMRPIQPSDIIVSRILQPSPARAPLVLADGVPRVSMPPHWRSVAVADPNVPPVDTRDDGLVLVREADAENALQQLASLGQFPEAYITWLKRQGSTSSPASEFTKQLKKALAVVRDIISIEARITGANPTAHASPVKRTSHITPRGRQDTPEFSKLEHKMRLRLLAAAAFEAGRLDMLHMLQPMVPVVARGRKTGPAPGRKGGKRSGAARLAKRTQSMEPLALEVLMVRLTSPAVSWSGACKRRAGPGQWQTLARHISGAGVGEPLWLRRAARSGASRARSLKALAAAGLLSENREWQQGITLDRVRACLSALN